MQEFGQLRLPSTESNLHVMTIVGQIEGHMILPPQNKTTKLGRQVLVQPVDQRRCQIVQLLSNDPSDFLVTALSPGNIIAFP